MRRIAGLGVLAISLLCCMGMSSAPRVVPRETVPISTVDRLAVRVEPGRYDAVAAAMTRLGMRLAGGSRQLGWISAERSAGGSVAAMRSRIARLPGVVDAQADARFRPALAATDPRAAELWGLDNTGQSGGTVGADIAAPRAWDYGTGSSEVVVAVVDTGVQIAHPDLAGNVWTNPGEVAGNGVDDDGNGYVDDVHGWDFAGRDATVYDSSTDDYHGTHVAGTIGAVGGNGVGVVGVNWRVSIMSLKFIGPVSGSGVDAAAAVTYAVDEGADVINCSFSGEVFSRPLEDAIAYAAAHDVIVVCAAGNSGVDIDVAPQWPASTAATNAVVVAATNRNDALPSFSNRGATSVDLGAPGDSILSTYPDSGYALLSGTSMATPHVTGALALLKSQCPEATGAQLVERVLASVDPLVALSGVTVTGGRLDVGAAAALVPWRPTISSPAPMASFATGSNGSVTVSGRGLPAPSERYEVQVRQPNQLLAGGDFDVSIPSGFAVSPIGAFHHTTELSEVRLGAGAARSATVTVGSASWMRTSVTVPEGGATLSFAYRALLPDAGSDRAAVLVDGARTELLVASGSWGRASVELGAGAHSVEWNYTEGTGVGGIGMLAVDDVHVETQAWNAVSGGPFSAGTVVFTVPATSAQSGGVRARAVAGGWSSSWTSVPLRYASDIEAPAAPNGLAAVRKPGGTYELSWTDPLDADFVASRVVRRFGATPVDPWDGTIVTHTTSASAVDTGLLPGSAVYYAVFACDGSGNWSVADTASVVVPFLGPPSPTALSAVRSGSNVNLSWTETTDASLVRTRVLRRSGTPPTGPSDPAAFAIFDGRGGSAVDTAAAVATETTLFYAAYSGDSVPEWSGPASTALVVDTIAPAGTFFINMGAITSATRFVYADSSVTGATQMRFDGGLGWTAWTAYADRAPVTLPGVGDWQVTAQYRDGAGNILQLTDTITVVAPPGPEPTSTPEPTATPEPTTTPGPVAPVGTLKVAGGAAWVTTRTVSVESSVSGATQMRFDVGTGWGAWRAFAPTGTLALCEVDGTSTVRAQYRGASADVLELSASVLVDTTPPDTLVAPRVSAANPASVSVGWVTAPDTAQVCVWRSSRGAFVPLARVSAPLGVWVDPRPPAGRVAYRLTAVDEHGLESAASGATTVTVRHPTSISLSVRSGLARVVLRDRWAGALTQRKVAIQVLTGGKWRTLTFVKTGPSGAGTKRLKLANGSTRYVRAYFSGEASYGSCASSRVRVRP